MWCILKHNRMLTMKIVKQMPGPHKKKLRKAQFNHPILFSSVRDLVFTTGYFYGMPNSL
jgi:hypothetical protein